MIKKRVAREGQGKRSGHRVLLAFKDNDRSIFIFGFSKNDRENLDAEEKEMYKKVAKLYLGAPMSALEKMCANGQLIEVHYEKK
ncbi:hypothetical protein CbuD7D7780_11540 (plasmid) [Coxiella burnetii]|uniref:Type II toxin-antitoxin system RelE/ParE family toxin n=1 Tax=Coxiella burnetii (strain Dugway 5J108-111) TaxID=434922 RepID=B5XHS9_COXBN|nr:type II toxin-antitoxin system RelE/ParE family toxin [Coxiella burnetii]ACI23048.1 hypothetical protein CBUD_A0053a [Coxiella burnetii Dugway 5J108-111]OYK79160.1 hypothetical protein CbuD7E6568_11620 [Coxiella burnetii]OYK81260.1 hypothetical protein CbuD7D7780_11540 [Coxiella burnetii]